VDHYQTLELQPDATLAQIKASYRRLAKRYHPDLNGEQGAEQMRQLNEAYAILGEPQRRQAYDQSHRPRPSYRVGAVPRRGTVVDEDGRLKRWLKEIYFPVSRLIQQVIGPLSDQLDTLADDPYDDGYVLEFQEYIDRSEAAYTKAWNTYRSQPNPPVAARAAEYLYHSLNQVRDGLDELGYFCMNYSYSHLHTGQEHFTIATEMRDKSVWCVSKLQDR